MTTYPFVDPVDGATCVVHFGDAPGVEHPYGLAPNTRCRYRATVHPDLDAYYCAECGRNGRITGAWFLDLLQLHDPCPHDSWTGTDQHEGPGKTWRCDGCGILGIQRDNGNIEPQP